MTVRKLKSILADLNDDDRIVIDNGDYFNATKEYEETVEDILKRFDECLAENKNLVEGSKNTELTWDKVESYEGNVYPGYGANKMSLEFTKQECQTLVFYLERALVDSYGLEAIGVGSSSTVENLESIQNKVTNYYKEKGYYKKGA